MALPYALCCPLARNASTDVVVPRTGPVKFTPQSWSIVEARFREIATMAWYCRARCDKIGNCEEWAARRGAIPQP
jgi:hypothetical protein